MNIIKKIASHTDFLALSFLLVFNVLIFQPVFSSGLLPVPGDLLVSFFFPWYSGGWEGYDSWTTHKEFIASDTIRQAIPWRGLAIDQLRLGKAPLWNPYNFSGTPLMANMQTAAFYPLNILFFILPFIPAWTIYIMLQPFLFASFTYLFIRSLGLKPPAALLGSLAVISSSFLIIWLELGFVGHTILWLPLMLFAIEKLAHQFRPRFFWLLLFASVSTLLAGHLQTAFHVFSLAGIYWLFRFTATKPKSTLPLLYRFWPLLAWIVATLGLTAFQLLPAVELRSLSPMTEPFVKTVFEELKTPWQNLITLFAPDFFGHPATLNFWSRVYGDGTPFLGVIALFFSVLTLAVARSKATFFWWGVTIFYLLYGFPGPLFALAKLSNLDIFTSTAASRALFIPVFALSILAAYGLDHFLKIATKKQSFQKLGVVLILFGFIYAFLWFLTLGGYQLVRHPDWTAVNLAVSKRNLIIPTGTLIVLGLGALMLRLGARLKPLFLVLIFVLTGFFSLYQYHKTLPFSPQKFFFPQHKVITFLQENAGYNRALGFETAKIDKNFSTHYRIFSPEGYDSLRLRRYAILIASLPSGLIPEKYIKSDADFLGGEEIRRPRLMDLLGVKYIHDKNDIETEPWAPELYKFPFDQVKLVWQKSKFKVYQRLTALDRAFLVGEYRVESNSQAILDQLYDPNFDLSSKLVLEEELPVSQTISPPTKSNLVITDYQPNRVTISTSADTNTLLFLSDAHYPGWKAFVDEKETPIYRADFAFRAIYLPLGDHQVKFIYQPSSFQHGLIISGISLLILSFGNLYLGLKHRPK